MSIVNKGLKFLSLAIISVSLSACYATRTQESTGQYIDNTAVTAKVKTALADKQTGLGTKSLAINVKTFKGTVQLSGFVDNQRQVNRASAVAKSVPGVAEVQNDIIVK